MRGEVCRPLLVELGNGSVSSFARPAKEKKAVNHHQVGLSAIKGVHELAEGHLGSLSFPFLVEVSRFYP